MAGIFNNRNFKVGQLCCLAFALLLATGCSDEVKADEHLVETFVELRLLDINYGGDTPMSRLGRQEVLKEAGYTREEYLGKIQKILDDPDQWIPFQRAVNARIDTLLVVKKSEEVKPSAPKSGPGNASANTPPRTRKGSVDDD